MSDLSQLSPAEIDTILAGLWERQSKVESRLKAEQYSLASHEAAVRGEKYIGTGRNRRSTWKRWDHDVERIVAAIAEHTAELAAIDAEEAPYQAEYRRRPWNRYFLVLNTGGHIHRERHCSTCRYDTRYGWLFDISGVTESEMVALHGERACTVCFPSAPTHPAYIKSLAEVEAAEAAKQATKCPASYDYTKHTNRYGYCKTCGAFATITSTGKLRAHKRAAS